MLTTKHTGTKATDRTNRRRDPAFVTIYSNETLMEGIERHRRETGWKQGVIIVKRYRPRAAA